MTTTHHDAWLDLTAEEAIEPELPICDAHHHLWHRPNQFYLLQEYLQDTAGGHNVVSSVFIECSAMYRDNGPEHLKSVGEMEFAQGMAACSASGLYGPIAVAAGIVGFADLTRGDGVKEVLEALQIAGHGRFRGIRNHSARDDDPDVPDARTNPPPHLLTDATFRKGFACLAEHDLSFDTWMFAPQLADLVDLAQAFPDTTIVLNHIGTPIGIASYANRTQEVFAQWSASITAVAACPNVVVKLGGIGMPICGFGWASGEKPPDSATIAETITPFLLHCIEQFGPDRCMFESNFPVDKQSMSFTVLWNAFKRVSASFSPSERASLLHDTAARIYRIDKA